MTERRQTTPPSDGAKPGATDDAPPRRDRVPEAEGRDMRGGAGGGAGDEARDDAREPAPAEADPLSRPEERGFDKRRRFME